MLLAVVASGCGGAGLRQAALADEVAWQPTRWPAAARVVAVGDLHGDLEATRRVLTLAGLIDGGGRWAGGEAVLVQTGDQLDRGDAELAILDLLDRLAREARASGGAVHVLNGNHELMNAKGDLRYVTPGGFEEATRIPRLRLDAPGLALASEAERARRAAYGVGGPIARRMARRNVVVVVGDTVFAHGGVTPRIAAYGIERLNAETRWWLRGSLEPLPEPVLARDGPVWSRHYSDGPDDEDCALLGEALTALGAARMVVGHTPQEGGISPACGGRVWRIDAGLAAHYGGPSQALEIAAGEARVLGDRAD